MSVPGATLARNWILFFSFMALLNELLHRPPDEAVLAVALGAGGSTLPGLPSVGVSIVAYATAMACVVLWTQFSWDQPRVLPWLLIAIPATYLHTSFTGTSISSKTIFPLTICVAYGIYCFLRSWNLKGSVCGTFVLGYWTMLIAADTLHLWPNLGQIRLLHETTGSSLMIGGVGWADGLLIISVLAIMVVYFFGWLVSELNDGNAGQKPTRGGPTSPSLLT
jgi:hypothetical protein